MTRDSVKIVFGGAPIGPGFTLTFADEANIEKVYKLLEEGGCDTIDMARRYGSSEEWMGKTGTGKRFVVDSKTPGGSDPGTSTRENIPLHAKETVERLGVKSVDVYHIRAPDPAIDLEEQLHGINEAYKAEHFKRFGEWLPLPTVYQANYSVAARRAESELLPTLPKLSIAFYVYSLIAGGLLLKTPEQLRDGSVEGRFGKTHFLRGMCDALYNKPSYHKVLELWGEAAKAANCSKVELAHRWVAFDSAVDPAYGDAVIFGASSHTQIAETLEFFERGSVGEAAKAKIDKIWKVIEHDVPLDDYNI
ncbi:Aldehyde reductase [Mycena sanguinolenta]|uniref:Aldehyde reductase n=1 Tax=Mycena sanguinolenta TaxID=230812 RepID=A0A8H6Y756_9AGAR|nr:Aldehyde reductase [Mycena sanguinolenta]